MRQTRSSTAVLPDSKRLRTTDIVDATADAVGGGIQPARAPLEDTAPITPPDTPVNVPATLLAPTSTEEHVGRGTTLASRAFNVDVVMHDEDESEDYSDLPALEAVPEGELTRRVVPPTHPGSLSAREAHAINTAFMSQLFAEPSARTDVEVPAANALAGTVLAGLGAHLPSTVFVGESGVVDVSRSVADIITLPSATSTLQLDLPNTAVNVDVVTRNPLLMVTSGALATVVQNTRSEHTPELTTVPTTVGIAPTVPATVAVVRSVPVESAVTGVVTVREGGDSAVTDIVVHNTPVGTVATGGAVPALSVASPGEPAAQASGPVPAVPGAWPAAPVPHVAGAVPPVPGALAGPPAPQAGGPIHAVPAALPGAPLHQAAGAVPGVVGAAVAAAVPIMPGAPAAQAVPAALGAPIVGAVPLMPGAPAVQAGGAGAAVAGAMPLMAPAPVVHAPLTDEEIATLRALFDDLGSISPDILVRLNVIANHADPAHNVYAVSRIPVAADWGRGRHEKFLTFNGTPVTIWLVGTVRTMWFFNRAGVPQTRVNIGINMAATRDFEAVRNLYQRARPRSSPSSEVIYASRFQSVRERGEPSEQAVPFDEVYDATDVLTVKSVMPQLSAADVAENDVVLVEATFTRWKKPADKKKKGWPTWDVGFELQSLSLIHTTAVAEPDAAAPNMPAGAVFAM